MALAVRKFCRKGHRARRYQRRLRAQPLCHKPDNALLGLVCFGRHIALQRCPLRPGYRDQLAGADLPAQFSVHGLFAKRGVKRQCICEYVHAVKKYITALRQADGLSDCFFRDAH